MHDWFREQMAMYMAYHRDIRNCATHFLGVPLIVFSILAALSHISIGQIFGLPVSLATLFLALLMLLYLVVVPAMGAVATIIHIPLLWYAQAVSTYDSATAWTVIIVCFVGGWVLQLVGHAFEGRRPALTDNLLQIFMAPGFLVVEALFACGQLHDLKTDLDSRSVKYNQVNA